MVKANQQPFGEEMHRKPNNQYKDCLHRALSPIDCAAATEEVSRQIEQFVRPRQGDDGGEADILIQQYPLRLFDVYHATRVEPPNIISQQQSGSCFVGLWIRRKSAAYGTLCRGWMWRESSSDLSSSTEATRQRPKRSVTIPVGG